MDYEKLKQKIEEAIKTKTNRRFKQSVELIVVLKDVDVKEIKNNITLITMPYYNFSKVVVFTETKKELGNGNVKNVTLREIEEISQSKRLSKKFARSFDISLSEQKLLPIIGKLLGKYLAPLGKMPFPITDEKRLSELIEKMKKSVKINLKQNQIQVKIGKEDMKIEELFENAKAALSQIISSLPQGEKNIKKIYVKLTMSKPIKVM
ncbi:MAG: 50S ribosomal protein L1 [Candidatus Aenigmatarchaeota archaeon]